MIRRIVSALTVVVACGIVVVLAGSSKGPEGTQLKMAFDNAFGLTQGGDLRVAGVKAGKTTEFDVSKGPECQLGHPNQGAPRTCAIVTGEINQPGLQSFRKDTTCAIRQQSLIGEYYVDCQPGNSSQPLPKKEILPDTQTSSTIPTDLVNDVLRRPYRDRLRLIISELGTGLAGRPQDIAELLRRAHPGLRETDRVLRILANQTEIIKNFISTAHTVVSQLDQRKQEVARWIVEASRISAISATRQQAIAAGFQRLPTFLNELRPTMLRLGQLTDAQTPLLHELQAAAPSLNTFLTELGPFSQASIPATRGLGQVSVVGRRAFIDSRRDIAELNAVARLAPSTAKPLRQALQTADDRKRAIDNDPRAKQSSPPSPDPNAGPSGKGFTAMQSLLNYLFWQTLAINEFDSVSHELQVLGVQDPQCSNYFNNAQGPGQPDGSATTENQVKRCNSWLGPYQPGTNAPDPTDKHHYPGVSAALARTRAKYVGERRGRGQPEAGPVPGQIDWSQPHPTLPPSTEQLLQSLGGLPATSSQPGPPGALPTPPSNLPSLPPTAGGGQSNSTGAAAEALGYLIGP